jgi:hypothetical protein
VKSMGQPFADDHGIMGKSHDFNIQLGGFHWLLIIIPIGIATTEGYTRAYSNTRNTRIILS